ncbi:MAG: sulfatase [Pirellulaceae bacterium]
MRLRSILFLFACIWVSGIASNVAAIQLAPDRAAPNVVLIVADDLGWTDLGCTGSTFYETPNLDRLAKMGTVFTNAYSTCQVCSPTRASLQTGKYPQRVGITDYCGAPQPDNWKRNTPMLPAPYSEKLALEEITLAEKLKSAGYATLFAGKWHLGPEGFWPEDQGFDFNFGGIERGGPYGGNKYFSPYGNPRITDGPDGEHLPDRLAEETSKFIASHRNQPFFANVCFYSVHTPLMAREDLKAKYETKAQGLDPERQVWGEEGERKVRLVQDHAVYAGMVEAMDQAVGKILKAIDDNGLRENTVVIFTSDNGGLSTSEGHPTSNLPLRAGKGWIYEGGIRVPTIVSVPQLQTSLPNSSDAVINSADFYPTVLELCNVDLDHKIDGKSFVPVLQGHDFDRGPIFWHYPHYGNQGGTPSAAVREGKWKLVQWFETGGYELFNLQEDVSELDNRIQNQPAIAERLKSKLMAWQSEVGAQFPSRR